MEKEKIHHRGSEAVRRKMIRRAKRAILFFSLPHCLGGESFFFKAR